MAKKQKKQIGKTREDILSEIKKLSERADSGEGKQFPLLPDLPKEEMSGFDLSMLQDTADPEKSHRLFYGMRRLMVDNLPKGKANKDLRQFIYDEKNLFLNRGKALDSNGYRGSDSRMTFTTFLEIGFQITVDWVKQGANATALWQMFYDENDKFGFHTIEGDNSNEDKNDENESLF